MRPTAPGKRNRCVDACARRDRSRPYSPLLLQQAQHLAFPALDHPHEPLIRRPARLPAFHYIVPRTLALPALGLRIEVLRKLALEDILLLFLVIVRGHLDLQLLAQGNSGRHPGLAQLVVALALEAILKLLAMLLEGIRQAKPLD